MVLDILDLGSLILPATLVAVPLTIRTVGGWAWAAWLPPRLRAIENRRALTFVERLVRIIAGEKRSEHPPKVEEQRLLEEFVESVDGIARILPDGEATVHRTTSRPVSDRLRALATQALERALAPGLTGDDVEQRDRIARACLEVLRKLPSPDNTDVLRRALDSTNPAIVRQTTSVIASSPRAIRAAIAPPEDGGDLEEKIYR
ncbi:MAG: hypothetical protein ACREQJ_18070, partial [Candidatus Binatia bacterium]